VKVISTSRMKAGVYSVEFDDGILVGIKYKEGDDSGKYSGYMCSLGSNSYFTNKGHYPKGQNLKKRLIIGTDTIKSRMQRYKRQPDSNENK
jgi:hypothetical protein